MEGNTVTRSMRAAAAMIARPADGVRWIGSQLSRRSPLDLGLPWISWKAIDFLQQNIRGAEKVFEWGGGGSTRFFIRRGCRLTTIESDGRWKSEIETAVAQDARAGQWELRYIAADGGTDAVTRYIHSVRDGGPWNVILVDGLEDFVPRVDCVREAARYVMPGGLLILDDAWRPQYSVVPEILSGWTRHIFRGLGPARMGVTQTDIYINSQ